MTTLIRKPAFRIWIEGHPQSVQGNRKHQLHYRERISEAALQVVPHPTRSSRIDIEIYFCFQQGLRPDVDNIIKPILDCLKGIVYIDDSQVRSIRVAALPTDEPFGISGWSDGETFSRLLANPSTEFLVEIFEGLSLYPGPC